MVWLSLMRQSIQRNHRRIHDRASLEENHVFVSNFIVRTQKIEFRDPRLLHGHSPPPDRSFRHFIIAVAMRRMVFPPNEPLCGGHLKEPAGSRVGSSTSNLL